MTATPTPIQPTEQASGEHITKAEEKVTLVDTVSYENVIMGQEYTVNATVMNQSTGESLKDAKGNEITATATFTAEATSGTIDLSVTIDASALESQSVVFYEALVTNGVQVGLHADITDENQTVHFPKIGTTAADAETEDHVAMAKENTVIVDSVAYENLIPGKEYTVTGTLMVKSTGKALTDANGNAVTASATFTPDTADGSVDITFTFDAYQHERFGLERGEFYSSFQELKQCRFQLPAQARR